MPLYVKPLSNICFKSFSCFGFFLATTRIISSICEENSQFDQIKENHLER